MSEAIEAYRAIKDFNKVVRAAFGVNCPQCAVVRPKAHPSILLPQQQCKVDRYRDPRPELTTEDYQRLSDSQENE